MSNRLNPIFDAIDNQNFDFAIKICNKAIKKDPNAKDILTLHGLKALAMVRSGMYQTGYDLAVQVKNKRPQDPHAVQSLFRVFHMLAMRIPI
jgi:hypothetical protein